MNIYFSVLAIIFALLSTLTKNSSAKFIAFNASIISMSVLIFKTSPIMSSIGVLIVIMWNYKKKDVEIKNQKQIPKIIISMLFLTIFIIPFYIFIYRVDTNLISKFPIDNSDFIKLLLLVTLIISASGRRIDGRHS